MLHEYRKVDHGETGEVPWWRWPEERGTNFRPDLVGTHPAGTSADFAGRTVLPPVQPAEPDCVVADNLRFALLFKDNAHARHVVSDSVTAAVQLAERGQLEWWLVPEDLSGAEGDFAPPWHDRSSHGRTALPDFVGGFCTIVNPALSGLRAIRTSGPQVMRLDTIVNWGREATSFMVANTGDRGGGDQGPVIITAGVRSYGLPAVLPTELRYGGSGNLASIAHDTADFTWGIWAVRVKDDVVEWYQNGALIGTAPIDPVGGMALQAIGNASSLPAGFGFYSLIEEVKVYSFALTPAEMAAEWAYFFAKYPSIGPPPPPDDALLFHIADPLELSPGDPLRLH